MANDNEPSISEWVTAACHALTLRAQVQTAAAESSTRLRGRMVQGGRGTRVLWHFLPLFIDDDGYIRKIAERASLPPVSPDVQRELDRLTTEVKQALDDQRKVTGFGRMLLFGGTRDKANQATKFLADYGRWFGTSGLPDEIARVAPREDPRVRALSTSDALADWIGLAHELPGHGANATIQIASSFAKLPNAIAVIQGAAAEEAKLRKAALDAGNDVRQKETDRMLAEMSVERLREASRDKIRVGVLTENGITNVKAVLANEHRLEGFEGIGETSAKRIRAAARTLRQNTFEEMPMRIDIKHRTPEHTEFLRRLGVWDAARRVSASSDDTELANGLVPIAAAIDKTVAHAIVVPTASSTVEEFRDAVETVARSAWTIANARNTAQIGDPWNDFLSRPADYFALLAELGFITEDDEKTHGDLPTEIIEAVREFELKADYLTASLRGYQSFAARFALVQRKVIIGDEMGLGKTVEAIAALTHLRAKGENNFLVVCPAAVVTNWVREVAAKSKLTPHRLHGPDRQSAAKNWLRQGGVGVTTFETLRWLDDNIAVPQLACVVVDEAHYIKNPEALRSQRTSDLIGASERAILLTGTPLENRLDEFRNLVGYLRPDLALDADEFSPKKFRRQVAPAYLRRNQEDVLTELPELVEVDEWITMSDHDASAYRAAVDDGNFMAMRQAGMKQGSRSAKMQRLVEIVREAEENGRRVIVFSHFLDVLRDVTRHMPGRVFGPLTGSVPANQRQVMVDDFSAARGGAVLVAQIIAGGVGLNIQAASVVVICEPQFKPTTEWQAIARAHRMGQLDSVQVHRLLSDEGVDHRVREILARKKELFEDFARESDVAKIAPEAYDVTEAELARDIIAAERERLFGQGVPASPSQTRPEETEDGLRTSEPANRDVQTATQPAVCMSDGGEPTITTTHTPRQPQPGGGRPVSDGFADRPRTAETHQSQAPVPTSTSSQDSSSGSEALALYPVFDQALKPISQTSADSVIDNVVRIVGVEGPLTGWRIHQVYKKCAPGRESHDEFSRLLNRAISAAERHKLILSENPFNQTGNKPRTFRLSSQDAMAARELGPRTIDIVPWAEVAQYCQLASVGQPSISDEELIASVRRLFGDGQLATTELRRAVLAAKRLGVRTGLSKTARGQQISAHGSAHSGVRTSDVCPGCLMIHAGECV